MCGLIQKFQKKEKKMYLLEKRKNSSGKNSSIPTSSTLSSAEPDQY